MPKKSKLATPAWILEGFDSEADYNKAKGVKKEKKADKTFNVKKCPECGSYDVNVVLTGEEGRGAKEWECKKCKWQGREIDEEELSEDEFMKYLDEKGEEVA